jgi:hypothetical protein
MTMYRRENNDVVLKAFCINYCKILNKFLQESK